MKRSMGQQKRTKWNNKVKEAVRKKKKDCCIRVFMSELSMPACSIVCIHS